MGSTRQDETLAPTTRIRHGGSGCTDVVLYRIDGFAHSRPSGVGFAPAWSNSPADGTASATANDVLWSFFEQRTLSTP
jgi:poly(3-hydroxybutyrate) depolymerase